jgi:hypothetical protein
MSTSGNVWPLGTPIVKGPFTSTNAYSNVFLKSSPISANYLNILAGGTFRSGDIISPLDGNNTYQKFNVITGLLDSSPINNTVTLPPSMALEGLIALQNDATASAALSFEDYFTINVNMFNQFAVPSTIITNMLGYGNKPNVNNSDDAKTNYVTTQDADIVAIWPHQSSLAIILSISDVLTYIVKTYRTLSNLTDVASRISEWRWLYPNRPRCVRPKSKYLLNILNPTSNINNTITFPQGAFMWDMLRYDFFEASIRNGFDTNNTLPLNDPDYPTSNDVFDIRYDYLAAPGCLLLRVKNGVGFQYDDGTGSIDKGLNTSRVIIKADNTITPFPVVFRIGLEWLEDFTKAMLLAKVLVGTAPTGGNPLLAGTNLVPTLRFFYRAFINCKRLYIWRLTNDIMRYRVNRTGNTVSPIAGGLQKGVYMCLLDGKTDYSGVLPNATSIPNPQWENLWVQKYINGVKDTLVVLTSVEIGAYISASFTNEGITPDKFGPIRIFTDLAGFPQQTFAISYIDFTNPSTNTITAESCYTNTNCWSPFLIPITTKNVPPPVNRGTQIGNIFLYVIIGIIFVTIIIVIIVYATRKPKIKIEKIEEVAPYLIPPAPNKIQTTTEITTSKNNTIDTINNNSNNSINTINSGSYINNSGSYINANNKNYINNANRNYINSANNSIIPTLVPIRMSKLRQ